MKVSQIMKKAYVIDYNNSLKQVAKLMSNKKIGGVIVIKNNKIVGIVTEKDIISNISKINSPVEKIMTKKIVSVSPNEDSSKAVEIMFNNKIKRLAVIEKGNLVGLIRLTDLIGKLDSTGEEDFLFN